MISITRTFRVICDECSKPLHMLSVMSEADAVTIALRQKWTVDGERHLCPYCTTQRDTAHTRTNGQCLTCGVAGCSVPTHVEYSRSKREQKRSS